MTGATKVRDEEIDLRVEGWDRAPIGPDGPAGPADHGGFFGVAADPQSYRNVLYLLLAFPLGTFYFVFLVTGISLGFGLIPVALVGLPLLIGVAIASRAFMALERAVAHALLGIDMPPIAALPEATGGRWARLTALRRDRVTWSGIAYLLLKFPIGVATFTAAVTLISTSLGMAFAPAYMWASDDLTVGDWNFEPYPWSFVLVPIGFILFFVSLHLMNWMAAASGFWCRTWLSGHQSQVGEASQLSPSTSAELDDPERRARLRLLARRVLEIHLLAFATVMAVLFIIDVATGGGWWFHWPLIGWGAAVALHAAIVLTPDTMRQSVARHVLYLHAVTFGTVLAMLFLFDVATGGGWWFYWLLIWGAGVALHAGIVLRVVNTRPEATR